MPSESLPYNALERIEPILDHLNFEACLHNLKQTWAVNAIDNGDGPERIKAVYTYARPEYAVAQAIADGAVPEDALREWQAAINTMLAQFRPKRHESLLVEAISALRHADNKDPGQAADRSPDNDQDTAARIGRFSSIDLALATLAVYQTRDIKDLLGELSANTAPLPGCDTPPQLDLKRIQESSNVSHQTHEFLQEENELLLLQLHQVQDELEHYYLRNLELEQKTKGREPEKEKHSVRNLERRVQLIEGSTSWRLTAPLRLFSQTLSRKKGPNPPPDASAPEEKRIRYLQRRIEQLETSTSWRVTAPLRAVGLLFKGRPGTLETFFPLSRRKLALEEAHKNIKALESQLSKESENRRKAEQLADERNRQLSQESEKHRKAEQLADERNRQLSQESESRRKAQQLAEERSQLLAARINEEAEARKALEERLSKVTADEGFYTRRQTMLQIDLDNLRERFAESERQRAQQEALLRKLTPRLAQAAQELEKLRIVPAPLPTTLDEYEPAQAPALPETSEPNKKKQKQKGKA
ncbi:MAG: hypothetical protein R6U98_06295 [Pirellulaceae bacterium]